MSRFNPCSCPAGRNVDGKHHAPDCPSYSGMNAAMSAMLAVSSIRRKQAAPSPDALRSAAQRLREYSRNPHHINPMSTAFLVLIDEASGLLAAVAQQEPSHDNQ